MAALGGGATALYVKSLDSTTRSTQVVTALDQATTGPAASGLPSAATSIDGRAATPAGPTAPARVTATASAPSRVGSADARTVRPSPTGARSGSASGRATASPTGGVQNTDGATSGVPTASRTAAPASPPAADSPDVKWRQEFVEELNLRRVTLGLPPVSYSTALSNQAAACSRKSLVAGQLQHCGHEVLWGGPAGGHSVQDILDAWFASPGHRTALTYPTSKNAGGAFVWRNGQAVAAITIDY
ncbi:MAG: CAP domain-containing protein [Kineosporiaceae bacterium]